MKHIHHNVTRIVLWLGLTLVLGGPGCYTGGPPSIEDEQVETVL